MCTLNHFPVEQVNEDRSCDERCLASIPLGVGDWSLRVCSDCYEGTLRLGAQPRGTTEAHGNNQSKIVSEAGEAPLALEFLVASGEELAA